MVVTRACLCALLRAVRARSEDPWRRRKDILSDGAADPLEKLPEADLERALTQNPSPEHSLRKSQTTLPRNLATAARRLSAARPLGE